MRRSITLAAGAALSVLRYRLYDVERVVTDSAAYAIASAAVIVSFVVVVVVISRTTPIDAGSQLPTIAGDTRRAPRRLGSPTSGVAGRSIGASTEGGSTRSRRSERG